MNASGFGRSAVGVCAAVAMLASCSRSLVRIGPMIRTRFAATLLAIAGWPLMALGDGATTTAPPIYPGAVASARPAGVGLEKPPPPQAKTYVTSDAFAEVKAWYQAHLKNAQELQQPGMESSEDAFLVGDASSRMVVLIQSYEGKTWIIIGPPM